MSREAAVDAVMRALAEGAHLPDLTFTFREQAETLVDAAAPHLAPEPVGYVSLGYNPDSIEDDLSVPVFRTARDAARHGDGTVIVALVPVDQS